MTSVPFLWLNCLYIDEYSHIPLCPIDGHHPQQFLSFLISLAWCTPVQFLYKMTTIVLKWPNNAGPMVIIRNLLSSRNALGKISSLHIVDSKMEDCSGIQCLKLQYLQKLHKEWARLLDNSPNDVMQYQEVNNHCPLLSLGQSRQWSCLTMAGWSSLPPMVWLKLL